MAFYNKLDDIEKILNEDEIKNYKILNVNNFIIPPEQKFDLICSWFSCGFHYPVDTYKNLILAHSHENTELVFDLRTKNIDSLDIKIVRILEEGEKHTKAVIKF